MKINGLLHNPLQNAFVRKNFDNCCVEKQIVWRVAQNRRRTAPSALGNALLGTFKLSSPAICAPMYRKCASGEGPWFRLKPHARQRQFERRYLFCMMCAKGISTPFPYTLRDTSTSTMRTKKLVLQTWQNACLNPRFPLRATCSSSTSHTCLAVSR